jgi:phage/plasmid-like protein (TIGR03299 family)
MLIKLNGVRSAEEALVKSGLDWSVEQSELISANGLDVNSHKVLFRGSDRHVLGVVGKDYEIIQNSSAFAFFDVIADRYGASYETAGIIKNGRKIFLQAKLGKSFDAVPGDTVDCYITLLTAHDGSSSLQAFLTPIRLYCQNQLIRAIKSATTNIRIKHTADAEGRIQDAMSVFRMSTEAFNVFKEKARYLARKIVDKQMVERFLAEMVETDSTRAKNQRQKLVELFENGRGNNTGKTKSAWQLYNSVTEFVDYFRTSNPEKSLESSMMGSGALLKEKAFEVAMAL